MVRGTNASRWELPKILEGIKREKRFVAREDPSESGKILPFKYQVGDILYVREPFRLSDPMGDIANGTRTANCEYIYDSVSRRVAIDESLEKFLSNQMKSGVVMPKKLARCFLKVDNIELQPLQNIKEKDAILEGVEKLYDNLSDIEYLRWVRSIGEDKKKSDWGYMNYLWHGNFGSCGTGNWQSDLWPYQYSSYESPVDSFSSLWNSKLSKEELETCRWDVNPMVYVMRFHVCTESELDEVR